MNGSAPIAEVRRDEPFLHGPTLRVDLLVEFAGQNQVLEHAEFLLTARQLALEGVDHRRQARDLGRLAVGATLTAHGRRVAEIELAVVQIRHAGQTLAECVETYHVGIHLTDAHRQSVDLLLQNPARLLDLALLAQQFRRPGSKLIDRAQRYAPDAQGHANRERSADDRKHDGESHNDHEWPAQVELFYLA